MSQIGFAACEGAPRDLGLDQGRALRDAIRADLRALGWPPRTGPWSRLFGRPQPGYDARLARDLARHFPHLDERQTGLAEGVGCPRDGVSALAAIELTAQLGAIARFDAGAQALELRWIERPAPTGLAIRRTQPDGGYANLTVTRPGVVFGVGGVNEHGLAGVAQVERPAGPGDRCHAPGALLLEQCIERLDGVEKALEWCERRPGGGAALLVFADATGASGAIAVDGERRTRVAVPVASRDDCAGPRVQIEVAARAIAVDGGGIAPARFTLASGS